MTVLCEQAAIFQCESLPASTAPPPTPPFFLVPSDDLKPVTLVLSPRPRTLVRRKQKYRCTLLLPEEQSVPPTSEAGPERHTRPKNCSLSGSLLFERLPCCPVYKLTWVGVSVTGLPVFVFKWNQQQQAVPSSFAVLVKSSCVQCRPYGKHLVSYQLTAVNLPIRCNNSAFKQNQTKLKKKKKVFVIQHSCHPMCMQ